jgi:hypothetical protein
MTSDNTLVKLSNQTQDSYFHVLYKILSSTSHWSIHICIQYVRFIRFTDIKYFPEYHSNPINASSEDSPGLNQSLYPQCSALNFLIAGKHDSVMLPTEIKYKRDFKNLSIAHF